MSNGSDLGLFVTLNYCLASEDLDYSARLLYGAVLFLSPSFESSLSSLWSIRASQDVQKASVSHCKQQTGLDRHEAG